ncbi:MAG: aldo/keto reductase, partial [Bacteroidales bacterium]|nr:aldo/keto reductase [Bacteroidales bacterium]
EADVDRMMKIATIKPAVLQNETHPYRQSKDVKAHIAPLGTILEAWFPLGGRGTGIRTLNNLDVIKEIASAHGKSTYQVLLRWHLQSGVIAIPGSTNPKHIAEDYDIFDFALTDEEMAKIDALERNQRFASY